MMNNGNGGGIPKGNPKASEKKSFRVSEAKGEGLSLAKKKFEELGFNPDWITKKADEKLVKFAEEAGKFMSKQKLTKSKIRGIYGEIKRIQMGGFEKEKASFYLLKPKVAYAYGRDNKNEGLHLFKLIFDECWEQVKDKMMFTNFCNLFEAILAYHKDKDKTNDGD